MGQVVLQQFRIDALLDVTHQQDAAFADLPEQDDRNVVDARPAIGRRQRNLAPDRPQHAQADLVDVQVIAGRQ